MRTETWDENTYVQSDNYYRRKLELAIAEFKELHPDLEIRVCDIQNVTRVHDREINFTVRLSLNLRDVFEPEIEEGYERSGLGK